MSFDDNSTKKRLLCGDSPDGLSVGSEKEPSTKRPRDGDSSDRLSVGSEKEPEWILYEQKIFLNFLGSVLSSPAFLKLFITHHFPNMSMEECARLLVETKGIHEIRNSLCAYYIKTKKDSESDVEEDSFDVDMWKKLMTTYVLFYLQRDSTNKVAVFFLEKIIPVDFIGHSIVNGEFIFHSKLFNYTLVDDGDFLYFESTTVRKDIRIHIGEEEVSFEKSRDFSNPAVILGKGAYGLVLKVFGTDCKWYVVKILLEKESALHEWDALLRVKGKHECFQDGVLLETDCGGDFPNIIISNFQGDVVLSKLNASHDIDFQQMCSMLFKLMKALKILHREVGICHGDIKPDNLILSKDYDGNPIFVLIDFGIANRIGEIISDPQKCYTWPYRCPQLFLDGFLRVYNTEKWSFVEQIKGSSEMDCWALLITFLRIICRKSVDFLGFCSIKEHKARSILFNASPVSMIMEQLRPYLGTNRKITMEFVRNVFFCLLKNEGSKKFVELFRSVYIETTDAIYEEYLMKFDEKCIGNPKILDIRDIFSSLHMKKQPKIDPTGPINEILKLFVEILCDGGDLSLLGCLTMKHIEGWLNRLKESHQKLCLDGVLPVFFC